ncbi:retrovirus-related Pol polyprotein from type-1 retrotransposable element R2 [Clonorchis sinensis]|uniref:Retrovirus-related Pol polyprotein from type-1 retrotransposable element R2 n=1 Tax=Clonorchis sinensis TaxID=79923 RepID=G7YJI9_CLOSI|nr:retrovirus-related Pol polyprotein from type-1 retrotransposable element R2 [Clonorchis sinensis]
MENMRSFFATLSGTPKNKVIGKPVGNNAQSTGTVALVADQETPQKAMTGSSQSKRPGTQKSPTTRVQFDVPEEELRPPEKQSSLRTRARTIQDRHKPKQDTQHELFGSSALVPTRTQERFVGLTCVECEKCCKSKAGLIAHRRVHVHESVGMIVVAQLAYADCSRSFPTKIGLSQHRPHEHPTQYNAAKLGRVNSGVRWSQQESQSLLRLADNLYPTCDNQTALFTRLEQYFLGRSAISIKTRLRVPNWQAQQGESSSGGPDQTNSVSRRRRQLTHRLPANQKQIRRENTPLSGPHAIKQRKMQCLMPDVDGSWKDLYKGNCGLTLDAEQYWKQVLSAPKHVYSWRSRAALPSGWSLIKPIAGEEIGRTIRVINHSSPGLDKLAVRMLRQFNANAIAVALELITPLDPTDTVTYLGIRFTSKGKGVFNDRQHLLKLLDEVTRAPLKPHQRMEITRNYLVSRLTCSLVLGQAHRNTLKTLDNYIRQSIRGWLPLPTGTPISYIHAGHELEAPGVIMVVRQSSVANRRVWCILRSPAGSHMIPDVHKHHKRVAIELTKRLGCLRHVAFEELRAPTSKSFIKSNLIAFRERQATVTNELEMVRKLPQQDQPIAVQIRFKVYQPIIAIFHSAQLTTIKSTSSIWLSQRCRQSIGAVRTKNSLPLEPSVQHTKECQIHCLISKRTSKQTEPLALETDTANKYHHKQLKTKFFTQIKYRQILQLGGKLFASTYIWEPILLGLNHLLVVPTGKSGRQSGTQEEFVGLTCVECEKCFKSKAGLIAHRQVHVHESVGMIVVAKLVCADCSRSSPTKIGLSQHRPHEHPTKYNAAKLGRVKNSGVRWSQQESQSLSRLAHNLYPTCDNQTALFARLEQYFLGRSAISIRTRLRVPNWQAQQDESSSGGPDQTVGHRDIVGHPLYFQVERSLQSLTASAQTARRGDACPLKPHQRMEITRNYLISRLTCSLVLGQAHRNTLKTLDNYIRQSISGWLPLPTGTPISYIHAGHELEAPGVIMVVRQSSVANRRVWCILRSPAGSHMIPDVHKHHKRVAIELTKRLGCLRHVVFEELRAPMSKSFIKSNLIAFRERQATVTNLRFANAQKFLVQLEQSAKRVQTNEMDVMDGSQPGKLSFESEFSTVKQSEAATDTLRVPKLVLIAPCGDHTQLSESTNEETSPVATQKALEITSPKEAIGGFRYLDPQNTGFVDVQSVTGYWTKLGIPDPETVLKKLGFPCQGQLDLKKLTGELESYMAINDSTDTIAVAAMLTLLNEWRLSRSTITTLLEEKARLYDEVERLKLSLSASRQAETIALERKYKHDLETNRKQSLAEQNALREHFAQQMETMRGALGKAIAHKSHLEEALDQEKRKTEDLCTKLSTSQAQLEEMESRTTGNEMKMFQLNRQNEKSSKIIGLENLEKLSHDVRVSRNSLKRLHCNCYVTNDIERFVQELKLGNPIQAQQINACIVGEVEYEKFNKLKEQFERAAENALLLNTQDNQLNQMTRSYYVTIRGNITSAKAGLLISGCMTVSELAIRTELNFERTKLVSEYADRLTLTYCTLNTFQAINKKLLVEKQQLEEKFKERENRMVEQQKGSATKDLELRESQNLNKQLMKIIGSLEKNLELQNKEIYIHQENSVHLKAELMKIKLENENLEKQTNQLQSQCRQLEYELNQRSDLTEIGVATRDRDSDVKSTKNPSMETTLLVDQLKQTLMERRCLLEYQSDLEATLKIQANQLETLQRRLENQEHGNKETGSKEQASDNRYKAPPTLQIRRYRSRAWQCIGTQTPIENYFVYLRLTYIKPVEKARAEKQKRPSSTEFIFLTLNLMHAKLVHNLMMNSIIIVCYCCYNTISAPTYHVTQRKHEGWIGPGYPSLERSSQNAEVGSGPRNFGSLRSGFGLDLKQLQNSAYLLQFEACVTEDARLTNNRAIFTG